MGGRQELTLARYLRFKRALMCAAIKSGRRETTIGILQSAEHSKKPFMGFVLGSSKISSYIAK